MITESEAGEIIYDLCRNFGVEIHLLPNMPHEEVKSERIIIITNGEKSSTYWMNRIIKINWCVPDVEGEAFTPSIKKAEKALTSLYYGKGYYNDIFYRFKKESSDTAANAEMRCHYANLTIMFQTLNTK
ncbi:MAG: hypothetical protein KBT34_05430 [Prevotella sp.]|nr:hypothetical protein [Candidatus Prevotella equi]